jgi:hypothetical protein
MIPSTCVSVSGSVAKKAQREEKRKNPLPQRATHGISQRIERVADQPENMTNAELLERRHQDTRDRICHSFVPYS